MLDTPEASVTAVARALRVHRTTLYRALQTLPPS
jgi:ActR/RegA family two-component response regulator